LALGERDIGYTPGRRVRGLDSAGHVAWLKTGDLPYNLFIGIPVHRAPEVVRAAGLTVGGNDGWVAVDRRNLTTRFPNVYARGDCADAPVPRAGVFAETAARAIADDIAARIRGAGTVDPYDGKGSCYIEFGGGLVGKVDADFLSGPSPVAPFLDHPESWPATRSASSPPGVGAGSAPERHGKAPSMVGWPNREWTSRPQLGAVGRDVVC
jgi:sulfide:quinone oxidoreductase